ncbi:MAG: branched-chain amino acid ABC transporter permease [Desulfobacterales bacterium]|nr:branched-chain amino acid ABC transporter permease [Desulfobacterales bacterium]
MSLNDLIEILISGITIGLVYFLIAVGFSLIYGVSRVLHLSYGSFFTWGAYLAWIFAVKLNFNYFWVFVLVCPILYIMGMALERFVVRPLRKRDNFDFNVLLAGLGVALFLDYAAQAFFGARTKSLPSLLDGTIQIHDFVFSYQQLTMLAAAVVIAFALWFFLEKTRQGLALGAVAQDPVGARIVGVSLNKVYLLTFGISTILAGSAGILLAPRFFISPLGGWKFLIKALIIVVAGGLGSIRGTLYSAFLLGILEALVGWLFGLLWVMPFWFLALLLILLIKPHGLLGSTADH